MTSLASAPHLDPSEAKPMNQWLAYSVVLASIFTVIYNIGVMISLWKDIFSCASLVIMLLGTGYTTCIVSLSLAKKQKPKILKLLSGFAVCVSGLLAFLVSVTVISEWDDLSAFSLILQTAFLSLAGAAAIWLWLQPVEEPEGDFTPERVSLEMDSKDFKEESVCLEQEMTGFKLPRMDGAVVADDEMDLENNMPVGEPVPFPDDVFGNSASDAETYVL